MLRTSRLLILLPFIPIVDDSTGVIQVVSLENGRRVISNNPDSPIPIGSLVRLTGALEETAYRGRRIQADKIGPYFYLNIEPGLS